MTGAVLVVTVGAVGVLHTLVPDHWAPIVVIARQRRWSRLVTGRAAALAGLGHVVSTLVLGVVLWLVGASAASRYGHLVSLVSAAALVAFGAWIAYGGWKEAATGGAPDVSAARAAGREASGRTALLLIVGSSPMIEGLPAFLSASIYGAPLLAVMAFVFASATIVTYVGTCVAGVSTLRASSLGAFERYGELLSGAFVAAVGCYALATA